MGEGEVEEGAGGCVGVVGVGCFVEGEEGEQAGDGSGGVVLGLLSGVVEVLGVGVGVVEGEGDGVMPWWWRLVRMLVMWGWWVWVSGMAMSQVWWGWWVVGRVRGFQVSW
nr:hypothetical protein [Streptomyces avermitilis]